MVLSFGLLAKRDNDKQNIESDCSVLFVAFSCFFATSPNLRLVQTVLRLTIFLWLTGFVLFLRLTEPCV